MRNRRGGHGVPNLGDKAAAAGRRRPKKTHRSRPLGHRLQPAARLGSAKAPHFRAEATWKPVSLPEGRFSCDPGPARSPSPSRGRPYFRLLCSPCAARGGDRAGAETERPSGARVPPGGSPPRTPQASAQVRGRSRCQSTLCALAGLPLRLSNWVSHLGIPHTAVLNWCVWVWVAVWAGGWSVSIASLSKQEKTPAGLDHLTFGNS